MDVFDDILISIARANREREELRRELDQGNTAKYQLLEVGAESFQLVRAFFLDIFHQVYARQESAMRSVQLMLRLCQGSTSANSGNVVVGGGELTDLVAELAKLREEMALLSSVHSSSNNNNNAVKAQDVQTRVPVVQSSPPPQLPFNAEMLAKQRRRARPITPPKDQRRPPPPIASRGMGDSIEAILQRAIQEKFKNATPMKKTIAMGDSDSSEDDDDEETPSFIQEKALMEEECERATRRPPVPVRPAAMRRATAAAASANMHVL